jgi:hypothetical protein
MRGKTAELDDYVARSCWFRFILVVILPPLSAKGQQKSG